MSRVQSVQRAFLLLQHLASGEMGITELSVASKLPKSTVARLLQTLEFEKAVDKDGETGRYRIGTGIASLAGATTRSSDIISRARPHLVVLANESGEDAGLAVPDGHRAHYIAQIDSDNPIQIRDWTGERLEMHAVASGQAILSHWPGAAVDRYLQRPLHSYTDTTITDPDKLRMRLAQGRQDGFSWVYEEIVEGLNAVAAAILDSQGRPLAALHIHGPAFRFPQPDQKESIAKKVLERARLLSSQLDAK